jgi:O-antigen ligase
MRNKPLKQPTPGRRSEAVRLLYHFARKIKTCSLNDWIDTAGVAGLYVFAFGMLLRKSIAYTGIIMMGAAFAFVLKDRWREVIRDRLVQMSIVFFFFLVFRTLFAAFEFPEHVPLLISGALKLFGTGFLLVYVTAFWLHHARGSWDKVLIVLMAGFLVQVLRQMDWGNAVQQLQLIGTGAERATFGFSTNRFGLFSAIILLACLLLHRPIWGPPVGRRVEYAARIAFWLLMGCLSGAGLVFSQSRSAWLGAALIIPLAMAFEALDRRRLRVWRLAPILAAALLVLIVFSVTDAGKVLQRRLAPGIDEPSVSARLSLYDIAWENWKGHPLFGRGPGTSWLMIQLAGDEHAGVKEFDHLHNVLFDMAAQVGVVGIVLIASSAFLFTRRGRHRRYAETGERSFILFALGGLSVMFVTGIVNQPFHSPHGVFLVGYLGGICYSIRPAQESEGCPPPSC